MVYTIGETLLDIIFKHDQPVSAKAGGSVLNSSVSLGRLGVDVSFISDYGNDKVGDLIDNFLRKNHVNTKYVDRFDFHKSALAMAFLDKNNNASYTFYKDFPDNRLSGLSIPITSEDYLLFGSFFAITESVRQGLLKLLKNAQNAGATIVYDPNFRKPHLHELDKVKPWIIENMSFADIVKGSDEDFELIFNASDPDQAYEKVKESGCENLLYTAGAHDVSVRSPGHIISVAVPALEPVSTIGAGDNFNAGIVYYLYRNNLHNSHLESLSGDEWTKMVESGITFASDVCKQFENYISFELSNRLS